MALPARKIDHGAHYPSQPPQEVGEALFRPVRKPNGDVVVEKIPLTLDVLLHPKEDDQVTQSRSHHKKLNPLADTLERFLERRPGVGVFSDLMILWQQLGERDVSPDVYVVKGVRDRDAIDGSFDPVAEGAGPCLVIEVVSTSSRAMAQKDEEKNPELFARMGVEDLVLLYPPRPGRPQGDKWKETPERLRLDVRRLGASGRYRANLPGPSGWIRLPSVGLRIKVSGDGQRLLIEDVKTGEPLLSSVEEEAARRAAERRAAQEAEVRRQVEERAEQGLRGKIEDLCGLLAIEWSAERSTTVADMDSAQLEALWTHLMNRKRWP